MQGHELRVAQQPEGAEAVEVSTCVDERTEDKGFGIALPEVYQQLLFHVLPKVPWTCSRVVESVAQSLSLVPRLLFGTSEKIKTKRAILVETETVWALRCIECDSGPFEAKVGEDGEDGSQRGFCRSNLAEGVAGLQGLPHCTFFWKGLGD